MVARTPPTAMNTARRPRPPRVSDDATISLRLAATGDQVALEELAELSGRAKMHGPSIVAEVDGHIWAALPLAGGEALVDPFRPTAELRALMSVRAKQLSGDQPSLSQSAGWLRRRFRSTPALADQPRLS